MSAEVPSPAPTPAIAEAHADNFLPERTAEPTPDQIVKADELIQKWEGAQSSLHYDKNGHFDPLKNLSRNRVSRVIKADGEQATLEVEDHVEQLNKRSVKAAARKVLQLYGYVPEPKAQTQVEPAGKDAVSVSTIVANMQETPPELDFLNIPTPPFAPPHVQNRPRTPLPAIAPPFGPLGFSAPQGAPKNPHALPAAQPPASANTLAEEQRIRNEFNALHDSLKPLEMSDFANYVRAKKGDDFLKDIRMSGSEGLSVIQEWRTVRDQMVTGNPHLGIERSSDSEYEKAISDFWSERSKNPTIANMFTEQSFRETVTQDFIQAQASGALEPGTTLVDFVRESNYLSKQMGRLDPHNKQAFVDFLNQDPARMAVFRTGSPKEANALLSAWMHPHVPAPPAPRPPTPVPTPPPAASPAPTPPPATPSYASPVPNARRFASPRDEFNMTIERKYSKDEQALLAKYGVGPAHKYQEAFRKLGIARKHAAKAGKQGKVDEINSAINSVMVVGLRANIENGKFTIPKARSKFAEMNAEAGSYFKNITDRKAVHRHPLKHSKELVTMKANGDHLTRKQKTAAATLGRIAR